MRTTAGELANFLGVQLVGNAERILVGIAKIEDAGPREVTFIANPKYNKFLFTTSAGAIILKTAPKEEKEKGKVVYLISADPYSTFLKTLEFFHPPEPKQPPGIHPSTVIADDVILGKGVSIGPLCVIEEGVRIGKGTILRSQVFLGKKVIIGKDCFFHSRVSVREGCEIGNRVIFQDGAVIGSDGFGFAPQESEYRKIPQVGKVIIEDDVEIGANTTIDRATMGVTRLCRGVKIDNLVQIAHNVVIGEDTVISAQSGIAGSSSLGKHSMLGGQVGINGHIRLSDGVMIAAQSGVNRDPGPNKIIGGYPAREITLWRRIEASISRLPEYVKRIRQLEEKLKE